jgi:PPOX class probable FMN-dependent enzyme
MPAAVVTDVNTIYAQPHAHGWAKKITALERHSRQFIAMSPFCVLSSADAEGRQDVSPRGGAVGFVRVVDDHTLLMPDRPGNNLLDSLRNVTLGKGHVGLLFFVPGFDETLRVNGRAEVLHDAALCEEFTEFGKPAKSVLRITVEEVFLHCGKALIRSRLWEADAQQDRQIMPSISEIITEQAALDRVAATQAEVEVRYQDTL